MKEKCGRCISLDLPCGPPSYIPLLRSQPERIWNPQNFQTARDEGASTSSDFPIPFSLKQVGVNHGEDQLERPEEPAPLVERVKPNTTVNQGVQFNGQEIVAGVGGRRIHQQPVAERITQPNITHQQEAPLPRSHIFYRHYPKPRSTSTSFIQRCRKAAWFLTLLFADFILGLIIWTLYAIQKHDIGTGGALCAGVWAVTGGAYTAYKKMFPDSDHYSDLVQIRGLSDLGSMAGALP